MQSIQPEMNKIREKYKDEPQRLQQESMALFKRSGVNPLSGCLPILLQLPIFFAFFKVLYNAVELVHAPFFFWIQDLSMKDPFYILPIIMTVAMYFQQKMTPTTTMDPTQQKIMQFMPVVFGLFMLNFPAGLALYTATSTILGIFQQMLVYRMIK
jgi:YidC/Oxa1 family membrane protein insertase